MKITVILMIIGILMLPAVEAGQYASSSSGKASCHSLSRSGYRSHWRPYPPPWAERKPGAGDLDPIIQAPFKMVGGLLGFSESEEKNVEEKSDKSDTISS